MKNSRARSFVMIMIIIAILALLLRVAIAQIIKINIIQNALNAQANLKLLSTALENYARDHQGAFPTGLSLLVQNQPPYLDKDYVSRSSIKGYDYSCLRLEPSGYNCSATPAKCGITGKMIYTVTTGGLFVSEECSKKE